MGVENMDATQVTLRTTSKTTANILRGMSIILKYEPDALLHGEHDEVYFGAYETREQMTPEEQAQMEEMGWRREADSWRHGASA